MTTASDVTRPMTAPQGRASLSKVPYLPGLDGMRAFAVVAVMLYHANSSWLPGGFLGVEVFFVISGYLITLLLMAEQERNGRIDLIAFWIRRARRLLPALFVMMFLLIVFTAVFRSDTLGKLRGDVLAGVFYVSNWFQIWVGAGYGASGDFAPLRHLWSLAVEEQFYLVWPIVMVLLLRRRGTRELALTARWLVVAALGIALITALAYHSGRIGECTVTPEAYWAAGERCISKADAMYLSTITRSTGILLGAAFAMVWRPVAIMRGPMRDRSVLLDLLGLLGLGALAGLFAWVHFVTPAGADRTLFQGGFLLTDFATLVVIAAVTHQRAHLGRALGNPVFLWIGTRSYGLYLYHWPIYQIIRKVAGNSLTWQQFAIAMVATAIITELSYTYVETPIRRGQVGAWLSRTWRQRDPLPRQLVALSTVAVLALGTFGVARVATAQLEQNDIEQGLDEGALDVVSADDLLGGAAGDQADPVAFETESTTTTTPPTTTTTPPTTTTTPPTTTTTPPSTAPAAPPASAAPPPPAPTTAAPTSPPTTAAPTTPPTTAAPAPPSTTVAPPENTSPKRVAKLAVGDSVMLGAAGPLADKGFVVNAVVSRQMVDTVQLMNDFKNAGVFGDVVMVHLGTNGPISNSTLDNFLAPMADVPLVILTTVKADRGWTGGNNEKIRNRNGGNVVVLDWAAEASNCPGNCFEADGIHLRPDGRNYYADLVQYVVDQRS